MAKINIASFRKHISKLDEEKLRLELEKLYLNVSQVRTFYSKGEETPTKKEPNPAHIEAYKKKIYAQFWTPKGNPKTSPSNANIRKYISEFEKLDFAPKVVIELILYRVEVATDYANRFGGMSDACYNASSNAFEKAVKLIDKHNLREAFQSQYEKLIRHDNLDGWYINDLENVWEGV